MLPCTDAPHFGGGSTKCFQKSWSRSTVARGRGCVDASSYGRESNGCRRVFADGDRRPRAGGRLRRKHVGAGVCCGGAAHPLSTGRHGHPSGRTRDRDCRGGYRGWRRPRRDGHAWPQRPGAGLPRERDAGRTSDEPRSAPVAPAGWSPDDQAGCHSGASRWITGRSGGTRLGYPACAVGERTGRPSRCCGAVCRIHADERVALQHGIIARLRSGVG